MLYPQDENTQTDMDRRLLCLMLFLRGTLLGTLPNAMVSRGRLSDRCLLTSMTGYSVQGVDTSATGGILAKLALNGEGCRAFGNDIANLVVSVEYETKERE
jgi:hypothetical protein